MSGWNLEEEIEEDWGGTNPTALSRFFKKLGQFIQSIFDRRSK
jgi:hypothetical protein